MRQVCYAQVVKQLVCIEEEAGFGRDETHDAVMLWSFAGMEARQSISAEGV